MSDIAIYKDGTVVLETTVNDDTIWLNQKQLCELLKEINRLFLDIFAIYMQKMNLTNMQLLQKMQQFK